MKRLYRLYVHQSGAYEVVPTGYSALAALLGVFWALGNGVFWRLVLCSLPVLPLVLLGEFLASGFAYIGFAYGLALVLAYFPLKAFSWRADVLSSRGYALRQEILANSSTQALARYAEGQPGAEA